MQVLQDTCFIEFPGEKKATVYTYAYKSQETIKINTFITYGNDSQTSLLHILFL